MKRILLSVFFCLITSFALAQAPVNYYNGTAGLTGYTLKTKLHDIIKNHSDLGYNGLWVTYQTSDRDNFYENDGSILDIYSENPSGSDPYNYTYNSDQCGNYGGEGYCYNREHIVPQSLFTENAPMRHDAHFIPPTDGYVNGKRSNFPFGVVSSNTWVSDNGSKLGPNSTPGYSGTVFEPINEFKGDIARMIFYFATRYQDKIPTFSSGNMLNGTTTQSLATWELNVLLAWHAADPVSPKEIARNNAIFARQNNRNPFIDNPSWVNDIWGTPVTTPDNVAPSVPTNLVASNITGGSATINWTASTDNVGVAGYNVYIDGVLFGNSGSTSINLIGLNPTTTYTITIEALDAAGNISALSAQLQLTTNDTPPSSTTSNEIYFSEYVEGSGNNKALEITNATSDPIDLSNYTIRKQQNGSGAWGSDYALNGILQPNTAFVIEHTSANFSCTFTSNIELGGYPLDFNGNDPVGLFKNGTLIDIIGNFNGGSSNFAENITLRRNVNNPSVAYTPSQWDTLAQNTCDNLGIVNPSSSLGTIDVRYKIGYAIYPNPVKNGELFVAGDYLDKIKKAEIFDINGRLIQSIENPFRSDNKITIKTMKKGIYILNLDEQSIKFLVD